MSEETMKENVKAAAKIKVVFCNDKYTRSHFRRPRGYGLWIFEITDPVAGGKMQFSATGTLTKAKLEATNYMRMMYAANVPVDNMPSRICVDVLP